MVGLDIDVLVDWSKLTRTLTREVARAGFEKMIPEAFKDANAYIPLDTGTLRASGGYGVVPSDAVGIYAKMGWFTPYARRRWFEGTPSRDKNPNASLQWALVAFEKNDQKYFDIMAKAGREVLERYAV